MDVEEEGDLFRVRVGADDGAAPDLARQSAGVGDADAEDALDASCLAPAELDLARWRAEGAAEALRDRFVTGESPPATPACIRHDVRLLSACLPMSSVPHNLCLLLDSRMRPQQHVDALVVFAGARGMHARKKAIQCQWAVYSALLKLLRMPGHQEQPDSQSCRISYASKVRYCVA